MNKYLIDFNSKGYFKHEGIDTNELNFIFNKINFDWKKVIETELPNFFADIDHITIKEYHIIRNKLPHKKLWQKKNRMFDQEFIDKLKSFSFYLELKELFGDFKITEKSYDGGVEQNSEEIYWRLVSPNEASDVGGLHADRWFHELHCLNSATFLNRKTIKIWLPIVTEPGLNGLLIVPYSNQSNYLYTNKIVNNIKYPVLVSEIDEKLILLEDTSPGQYLCFGENFIHGGAINNGKYTRISIEITISIDL
jgi:hypothetical protein